MQSPLQRGIEWVLFILSVVVSRLMWAMAMLIRWWLGDRRGGAEEWLHSRLDATIAIGQDICL
jgi:hypothetical protein